MKTLAIALLLVSSIAHADEVDGGEERSAKYSLDIGSHIRWFGDTSAAIVSTDQFAGVRLTAGRSLTETKLRSREVEIGAFARYVYGGVGGTMFGSLDTAIRQHLLGGGLRAEAPVRRWLALVGQAELGMSRTSLRVEQNGSLIAMTPADDSHWAPYAATSLGFELQVPRGRRIDMSLAVDVGYIVTVPVELHALPGDRPEEDLSIATTFAGVGKLDTRGFTYSLAFRGRF